MDWHKLQHTLYDLDPTDPREDLQKLQQSLQGNSLPNDSEPQIDYVAESYQVSEGSVPLDRDYSVNDFAALAGVTLSEGKQKAGDQVKGKEPKPKAKPGRTDHPYKDRLVGDSTDNNDYVKSLEERISALEAVVLEMAKKNKNNAPKERNPHSQDLSALRKSGAGGAHKDKKRQLPRKQKHKSKMPMESLKDELYKMLNEKK